MDLEIATMPRRVAAVKAATYDADAHTVEWVMSSETQDRDGEFIKADGWTIAGDVPLLWAHQSFAPDPRAVIGKVDDARVADGQFIGTIRFSQANPDGVLAEAMVAEGVLTNGSVGFEPLAWMEPDGMEGARDRGGPWPYPKAGRVYTRQELVEFSIVPVPSNPDAMVRMAKALHGDKAADDIARRLESLEGKMDQILGIRVATAEDIFRVDRVECEEGEARPESAFSTE